MSLLIGAVSLALLVAAGLWPMRVLAAPLAGPTLLGRSAVACALGAALTGLVQVALSAGGVPAGIAVPAVLAGLSLALELRRRRGAATAGRRDVAGPGGTSARAQGAATGEAPRLPRWLAALLLAVSLVLLGAGVGTPFRSDGSKFWAPKARELARFGASEAPLLHDPHRLGLHNDYPLLAPALLAPVFALAPPDGAAGPKLLLTALTLALLGVLATLLPRCGTRGVVLLAVFATQPLLVSLDVRESAVTAGFVDSLEALFLLLFVVAAVRVRDTGERDALLLACLMGGALAATKLEGAVEAACVLGAALLAGPRRGALLGVGAGVLLLALPTLIVRAAVVTGEPGFELARLLDAQVLEARLLPVLAGLLGVLVDVSSFGLLPLLLLLWTLQGAPGAAPSGRDVDAAYQDHGRATQRTERVFGGVLCLLVIGFLLFSYLSTSMQASRHIDTSAHRLLWHWLPASTWLVARSALPRLRRAEAVP